MPSSYTVRLARSSHLPRACSLPHHGARSGAAVAQHTSTHAQRGKSCIASHQHLGLCGCFARVAHDDARAASGKLPEDDARGVLGHAYPITTARVAHDDARAASGKLPEDDARGVLGHAYPITTACSSTWAPA